MCHTLFNSGLAVVLMFVMCYFNAFQKIWPAFGAANQMLAAMALLVVSLWLLAEAQAYFTLLPALFMTVTTIGALGWLFFTDYLPHRNVALMVADVVMVMLALAMVVLAVVSLARHRRAPVEPSSP